MTCIAPKPRPMAPGKEWQRALAKIHERYLADGRAEIWQRYPPYTVLRRQSGDLFQGRADGRGPVDFSGALAPGGRYVSFDAKDWTTAERWQLRQIELHQAEGLGATMALGGLAFIALRDPNGVGWALPWRRLGPRWWAWHLSARIAKQTKTRVEGGGASLDLGEIAQIGLRMPEAGDWLTAFETAAQGLRRVA